MERSTAFWRTIEGVCDVTAYGSLLSRKSVFVGGVVPFAFRPPGFMLMRPVGLCVQAAICPYVSKLPTDTCRLVRALLVTSTNSDLSRKGNL